MLQTSCGSCAAAASGRGRCRLQSGRLSYSSSNSCRKLQQLKQQRLQVAPLAAAASDDVFWRGSAKAWQPVMDYTAAALLLCNIHRNTFSVLLPHISSSLHLSPSSAGQVQAVSLLGYLVGQMPAGTLADKMGGTRVLIIGLLLWSAATAMTALPLLGAAGTTAAASSAAAAVSSSALSCSLLLLLISRVLMGLTSAAAMPCVTAISAQQVPASDRGSAVSVVYACFSLGGVVGLAVAPHLAAAVGLPGAFMLTGLAGIICAVYGWITLKHNSSSSSSRSHGSRQSRHQAAGASVLTAAADSKQQETKAALSPSSGWKLPAGRVLQQMLVLCYSHAVMGYGFFILQNWIPMYLASVSGHDLAVVGGLSSIPWLAAALVGPMVGRMSDHMIGVGGKTLTVRRIMQNICFLGCAASVVPLAVAAQPDVVLAVCCLTASLAFYSFSHSGFHSYLQDVASSSAGAVYGVTNTCSIAVGVAGNLITGKVIEATGSYSAVFVLFAVLNVSAAVVFSMCTSMNEVRL